MIYIKKSEKSEFHIWKTTNDIQTHLERIRDNKNNYPICVPIPPKNVTRMDCLTDCGYAIGLHNIRGTVIGFIKVNHFGISAIIEIENNSFFRESVFK